MFQKTSAIPGQTYTPSKRFSPVLLLMLAIAACVAVGMAYVLYLAERAEVYYYFFAPLLVGAPVMGAIALAVYFGKCRFPLLAGVAGLGVMLVFYVGYWQISYSHNVGHLGALGDVLLKQQTGVGGLPGYFLFRCQNTTPSSSPGRDDSPREPGAVDAVFNHFFFGGELLMLSAIGLLIGRAVAGRVFYEEQERWGSSFSFRVAMKDEDAALAAIEKENWAALAALPKVASELGDQQGRSFRVKAEYLKGAANGPVYLTVWPAGAKSSSGVLTLLDKTSTSQWKQRAVTGESAARFTQAFAREMSVTSAAVATPRMAAAPGVMSDDPRALRQMLMTGAAGGAQVQAISPEAIKRVQRFHWGFNIAMALCLVLGLGGAVAMIVAGVGDDDSGMTAGQIALATVFVVGLLGGGLVIVLYWRIRYALLRREFAGRPGSLIATMKPRQCYRVSFAKEFHLKEKSIEDIAVVGVDDQRQLVIEGMRYRYIIPATAVKQIAPVQSDATLAIEVDFDAAGQVMQLMLWRDNMKGHLNQQIPMISAAKDAQKAVDKLRERLESAEAQNASA